MVAVITGTIKPADSVGQLSIKNEDERRQQYIDCLKFFIESGAFKKIVFCENSNYGNEQLMFLQKFAENNRVNLEILSFQGNIKEITRHGKGYGEGEIMSYVLKHSELVKKSQYLVKITGRMKVDNIKDIVALLKRNRTYFNIPNFTLNQLYDTRIYGMSIQQFEKYFENCYDEVWDDRGVYLEHIYTKILKEKKIKVMNFPRYPRIVGISGSTGLRYSYCEWKCKVKDILSLLGCYRVK